MDPEEVGISNRLICPIFISPLTLFADHLPDPETADAVEKEIARLKQEEEDALDHRY